jgi:predicted dehydrogenase
MKVGVIGLGAWGRNMLRVIQESRSAQIALLCDRNETTLAEMALRSPQARTTTAHEAVIASPDVKAVYIATPPDTHFAIASAALSAGKHVLVEKPLATSSDLARQLADQAETAGLTLMVGHTFVYSPPVRKIKELIASGALGKVFYIDSQRVNLGQVQDSGVIWDLAPHDLSILQYWLGETPSHVHAVGRSYVSAGREDVAFITLQYDSGVVAQLHLSWLAPTKLRRTTVTGDRKMVVYDDLAGPEAVKIYDQGVDRIRPPESFGEFQLSYRTGDVVIPRLDNFEPLRLEWDHFLECVSTRNQPATSAKSGVEIVSLIERIRASSAPHASSPYYPSRIED